MSESSGYKSTSKKLDFEGLNRHLLQQARRLLPDWIPGGSLVGAEYKCADIFGGKGNSMSINIGNGKWCDFARDEHKGGDLISLYQTLTNLSPGEAYKELADKYGYLTQYTQTKHAQTNNDHNKTPEPREPKINPPSRDAADFIPPSDASDPDMFSKRLKLQPSAHWIYRTVEGLQWFRVARYDIINGTNKKEVLPWTWSPSSKRWVNKQIPKNRPLYDLPKLKVRQNVLIVEGEKAAEAAKKFINQEVYAITTWSGGSSAINKTNWEPLKDKANILIWPDFDKAGYKAAQNLIKILTELTPETTIKVINLGLGQGPSSRDLPQEGHDAADCDFENYKQFTEWALPDVELAQESDLGFFDKEEKLPLDAVPKTHLKNSDSTKEALEATLAELEGNAPSTVFNQAQDGTDVLSRLPRRIEKESNPPKTKAKNSHTRIKAKEKKTPKSHLIQNSMEVVPNYTSDELSIFDTKDPPKFYFRGDDGKAYPDYMGFSKYIATDYHAVSDDDCVYLYEGTHYKGLTRQGLDSIILRETNGFAKPGHFNNFSRILRASTYQKDYFDLENTGFLNLSNGYLNIKEKTLEPHKPEHKQLKTLETPFMAEAKCPKWEIFLNTIFENDKDLIELVREMFGYVLICGKPFLQKAFVLVGTGSNGKSTLIDVLQYMVGESNFSSVSMKDLDKPFSVVQLKNKIVNLVEETPRDAINPEAFKAAVGGAYMIAAHKGVDEFQMRCKARFIFACNHMPVMKDDSVGMLRRLCFIPFDYLIPEDDRDPEITDRLITEMSGILNWALIGAERISKPGARLTRVQRVEDTKERYQHESDSCYTFFEDHIKLDPDGFISKQDLYQHYLKWSESEGIKFTVQQKVLTRKIREYAKARVVKQKLSYDENAFGETRRSTNRGTAKGIKGIYYQV